MSGARPVAHQIYTYAGTVPTGLDPVSWAVRFLELRAGEILLTWIDGDGTMTGYDLPLLPAVSERASIPVITSGGAGNFNDMAEALGPGKASAVAAASICHFTQQTPHEAELYVHEHGFPIRIGAAT